MRIGMKLSGFAVLTTLATVAFGASAVGCGGRISSIDDEADGGLSGNGSSGTGESSGGASSSGAGGSGTSSSSGGDKGIGLGGFDAGALGITPCETDSECAKGETCTTTPFGIGFCSGGDGLGLGGSSSGLGLGGSSSGGLNLFGDAGLGITECKSSDQCAKGDTCTATPFGVSVCLPPGLGGAAGGSSSGTGLGGGGFNFDAGLGGLGITECKSTSQCTKGDTCTATPFGISVCLPAGLATGLGTGTGTGVRTPIFGTTGH
jgi:hypothetical protein